MFQWYAIMLDYVGEYVTEPQRCNMRAMYHARAGCVAMTHDNSAEREMSASALYSLYAWFR